MIPQMARGPLLVASLVLLAGCINRVDPMPAAMPEIAPVATVRPEPSFEQVGRASWYGDWHHGKKTASGAKFDKNDMTAAHRTLPLGTEARVTNVENGRSVTVTVNDRGPYKPGRVLDLSERAAKELGKKEKGLAQVKIEVMDDAPSSHLETATVTD